MANRRTLDSRLAAVRGQSETESALIYDLAAATAAVSGLENDLMQLCELRHQFMISAPNDRQWQQMSMLAAQCKRGLRMHEASLDQISERLSGCHPTNDALRRLCQELRPRLAAARSFLEAAQEPGYQYARTIEIRLPAGSGERIRLESRVMPGPSLGLRFAAGYPSDNSMNRLTAARFQHLHELQHTDLLDAAGRTLYAGLQHGIVTTGDLNREQLMELCDADLQPMVDALLIPTVHSRPPHGGQRALEVQLRTQRIRQDRIEGCRYAEMMAETAYECMARETAAAALVTDREKFKRALSGERVGIRLFNVALLTPQDCGAEAPLAKAFNHMHLAGSVELRLRDPDGQPRAAHAAVSVRQFVLAVDNGRLDPAIDLHLFANSHALLGPWATPGLGGDVGARVRELRQFADEHQRGFESLRAEHSGLVRQRGEHHPDTLACNARLAEARRGADSLRKQAQALQDAGCQLKSIWKGLRGWPGGVNVYAPIAARLALIAYLMGETPVISCLSGNDVAGRLDADIKALAATCDARDGRLPQLGQDDGSWQQVRDAFAPP